jgi:hypothetical protein
MIIRLPSTAGSGTSTPALSTVGISALQMVITILFMAVTLKYLFGDDPDPRSSLPYARIFSWPRRGALTLQKLSIFQILSATDTNRVHDARTDLIVKIKNAAAHIDKYTVLIYGSKACGKSTLAMDAPGHSNH